MIKILLTIVLLLFPITSFSQSPDFGNTYNSKTGKKDMCIRIRSEDGTTIDSVRCKELRIPNGYIEEVGDFFLISVGKCPAVTKTSDYTVTTSDCLVLCDASNRTIIFTLPTIASSCTGSNCRILDIKKIDSSSNFCIVDGNGSETIDDGLIAKISAQYESIKIQADGTRWYIK